jgi:hypothetical protein
MICITGVVQKGVHNFYVDSTIVNSQNLDADSHCLKSLPSDALLKKRFQRAALLISDYVG